MHGKPNATELIFLLFLSGFAVSKGTNQMVNTEMKTTRGQILKPKYPAKNKGYGERCAKMLHLY